MRNLNEHEVVPPNPDCRVNQDEWQVFQNMRSLMQPIRHIPTKLKPLPQHKGLQWPRDTERVTPVTICKLVRYGRQSPDQPEFL